MTRPVMPLFEYLINKDYIAEFLCVNKDKVELECEGKCYLMQKLEQQNDEKRQHLPKIAMEEYPIGFVSLISLNITMGKELVEHPSLNYHNLYCFIFLNNSFHPPNFIV